MMLYCGQCCVGQVTMVCTLVRMLKYVEGQHHAHWVLYTLLRYAPQG